MYTIKELCTLFKISRPTVYKWITEGFLTPIKIGKSVRFSKEEIEKLMKGEF